jgi:adenylate kinase
MFLVFLGAPGAGKGTQAAVVAEKTKLAHIATGDLFRAAVKAGTELGKLAQGYMQQGKLVPDEVTIGVITEKLKSSECAGGAIFDGFPRTLEQASALDKALKQMGKKVDRVISIDVPDGDLLKRLGGRWTCQQCQAVYHEIASPTKVKGVCDKCGGKLYQRADDNETTIKERLKVYHAQTAPLLDYYKKADKVVSIDGTKPIENVTNQILKALGK